MRVVRFQTPLSLIFTNKNFLKKFSQLNIQTVGDLFRHFPVRYEDFSKIRKIADLEPGEEATVQGTIAKISSRRSFRRYLTIVEAVIEDETGSLRAVWFNQPYLIYSLRPGKKVSLAGKVSLSEERELYLAHPAFESQSQNLMNTGRLIPVYHETRGLTSKGIRRFIQIILKRLEKLPEFIPTSILKETNLPEINEAFKKIHFPESLDEALSAKRRFAFEELFLLQLFNLEQKLKLAKTKAPALKIDLEKIKKIISSLPFELTLSQKKSLWEIIKDLQKSKPMNRLLQGDVGSGKTVVAVIAALLCALPADRPACAGRQAQNGYQTAFLAPTEILARQHFETLKKLFGAFEQKITIGILTGSISEIFYENDLEAKISKKELIKKISEGEIKIIIGTHAIIQKSVRFKKLALVIVDEQHRFGVKQRAALASGSRRIPHFLSLSATPIPRTLSLTIFGDLDLSLIEELPKGRIPIITRIIPSEKRAAAYKFIGEQIKNGRQVFVICPRIEIPENNNGEKKIQTALEIKSVKEEYEKLSKKIFPQFRVAMIHGKMPTQGEKSKEEVMRNFKKGKVDILVSTSVIEVGIDIPNASIMMIEGSERFGLSQLYQFRGRVGRGEHQSYCFLFTDSPQNSESQSQFRLNALIKAKNGFELAEADLKLRGPGEFLGTKQTGFPDLAMKALQNPDLVKISHEAALKVLKSDPSLKNHSATSDALNNFKKSIHQE